MVRSVSPLLCKNETYSFIHKSVQEFFVAMDIRDSVLRFIEETSISPIELKRLCDSMLSASPNTGSVAQSQQTSSSKSGAVGDNAEDESTFVYILHLLSTHEGESDAGKAAERKRRARGILKLVQGLRFGPLHTIDLSGEEAVRDFLLDTILDDINVAASFGAVASLCLLESVHHGQLAIVRENLRLLFTTPMPKRNLDTLVHIACREGSTKVLDFVLSFCLHPSVSTDIQHRRLVLVPKNKFNQAPLAIAIKDNNWEVCDLLFKYCDNNDRQELILDCEARASESLDLTTLGKNKHGFYSYRCGAKIPVDSGRVYYEVELDPASMKVTHTKMNPLKGKGPMAKAYDALADHLGLGASIGIGFAAGRVPASTSLHEDLK
eukprot:20817-Rhodomonas_salina.1